MRPVAEQSDGAARVRVDRTGLEISKLIDGGTVTPQRIDAFLSGRTFPIVAA